MNSDQMVSAESADSQQNSYDASSNRNEINEDSSIIKKPQTPSELANEFEWLEEIGHGSQGHIYLSKDLKNNRLVAIKQLKIASVTNWKEYQLFKRESDVLSTLSIPGVAKFYESREYLDISQPAAYIIQEYLEGQSLAQFIKEGFRFSIHQIYEILLQCLDILEALHHHEPAVIHRDIKPSNIMLCHPDGSDSPQAYLIDFGAVANPQVQGGGSTVAGTFGYMPPEQLMGKPVPQSDIYSLAATAVQLFSGISPADMQMKDFHLIFEPHMQSMPTALIYTLRAMLDTNAETRLCDYHILKQLFRQFQKGIYDVTPEISVKIGNQPDNGSQNAFKYNNRLNSVSEINAPGNTELWQMLPNQTPRKIPYCYRNIRFNNLSSRFFAKSIQRKRNLSTSEPIVDLIENWAGYTFFPVPISIKISDSLKESNSCCASPWLGFMALIWMGSFGVFFGLFINYPVLMLCYTLITGFFAFRKLIKSSHPSFQPLNTLTGKSSGISLHSENKQVLKTIKRIVENGTKTIATITNIQYVPQHENIYINTQQNKCICTNKPLYRIKYSFNPADDHNPDDLVHEIYTRTPPEDHYSVGDPLPILYLVLKDHGYNNMYEFDQSFLHEFVFSIPFPMLLHESIPLDRLVGRSYYKYENDSNENV